MHEIIGLTLLEFNQIIIFVADPRIINNNDFICNDHFITKTKKAREKTKTQSTDRNNKYNSSSKNLCK